MSATGKVAELTCREEWRASLELATREVFRLMLGSDLGAGAAAEQKFELIAMVGLAGKLSGVMSLSFTPESAAVCAAKMLGSDPAPVGENTIDAIGELANMIAGNFKTKITELAQGCMLSVPTVVTGTDYTLYPLAHGEPIEVRLSIDGLPLRVVLQSQSN